MKTTKTVSLGNNFPGSVSRYEKALGQLRVLLGAGWLTAREISKRTKCSKKIAYRRLEALRAQGVLLAERQVRERGSGPLARAFTCLE